MVGLRSLCMHSQFIEFMNMSGLKFNYGISDLG